jgi:hypothetical protein
VCLCVCVRVRVHVCAFACVMDVVIVLHLDTKSFQSAPKLKNSQRSKV